MATCKSNPDNPHYIYIHPIKNWTALVPFALIMAVEAIEKSAETSFPPEISTSCHVEVLHLGLWRRTKMKPDNWRWQLCVCWFWTNEHAVRKISPYAWNSIYGQMPPLVAVMLSSFAEKVNSVNFYAKSTPNAFISICLVLFDSSIWTDLCLCSILMPHFLKKL